MGLKHITGDTPEDEIIRKLIQCRVGLGFSQRQLAEKAGVSKHLIMNIEGGKQVLRISNLYSLASALGLEFSDVLPEFCDYCDYDSNHREHLSKKVVNGSPRFSVKISINGENKYIKSATKRQVARATFNLAKKNGIHVDVEDIIGDITIEGVSIHYKDAL